MTYLIPIVDHVLRTNPEQHRVRAIIVYPMNALINSQENALKQFAEANPGIPVRFDIRIRRNVRATGFSGGAFGTILGNERYLWERRLGNAAVAAGKSGIRIADPSASEDLLNTAYELFKERRRVLFFCSCEYPNTAIETQYQSLYCELPRKLDAALK